MARTRAEVSGVRVRHQVDGRYNAFARGGSDSFLRAVRRLCTVAWALGGLAGCSEEASCPEGYARDGGVCVVSGSGSGDSGSGGGGGSGSACGECPERTPICDEATETCVVCLAEENAGCGGDNPVCLAGSTSAENRCVACTAEAQEACGEGTCNVLENTCTEVAAASVGICGGCQGSNQCGEGMACVQTEAENKEAGYFCQHLRSAQGDNCPANAVPYFSTATRDTAEGGEAEVCALSGVDVSGAAKLSRNPCTKADAEGHAACGLEGFSDGYCVEVPRQRGSLPSAVMKCTSPDEQALPIAGEPHGGAKVRLTPQTAPVDNFPSGAKVCNVN